MPGPRLAQRNSVIVIAPENEVPPESVNVLPEFGVLGKLVHAGAGLSAKAGAHR